jgi:hypothetical protein
LFHPPPGARWASEEELRRRLADLILDPELAARA